MKTRLRFHLLGLGSVIEALAEDRYPIRDDAYVRSASDLVPLATTRRVTLWQPPLLDEDQHLAISEIAAQIDRARSKFETTSCGSGRTLADQHRAARGREATYTAIAEVLVEALRIAEAAGLELRVTTSLVTLAEEGVQVRRVVLKAIPAKAANRAA